MSALLGLVGVVVGAVTGYLVGKGVILASIGAEIAKLEASVVAEEQKLAADIKAILKKLGL